MCVLVLLSEEVRRAPVLAQVPAVLRAPPEGLGWFVLHVPISTGLARLAQFGVALGCFAGLVGYRARLAMGTVAVCGFYVFALGQLTGTVLHDMHLLWFATVLAASPCGDALSFFSDEGPLGPGRARAYTAPLTIIRLLFAAIYFFPGYWKLRESRLAWALGDNLRNQMYAKWFEWGGRMPPIRIDQHPTLVHTAALGVLALELTFPLLVLSARGRVLAVLGGLLFHLAGAFFLYIHFASLWACYVALIDWGWLADRCRRGADALRGAPGWGVPPARSARAALLVGIPLLAGALVQGFRGAMFAYPIACYPTFQWIAGAELPDLELDAEYDDGHVELVDAGGYRRGRTQEAWGTAWSVAGLTHGPTSEAILHAYWDMGSADRARGAKRGHVSRVAWSILPADYDRPPITRREVAVFALDPRSGKAL